MKRSASCVNTKTYAVGDLTSGRAFDNGCSCHQSSAGRLNSLVGRHTECYCGAPRLQPQLQFIKSLMDIGKKLQQLPTKEARSECLTIHGKNYMKRESHKLKTMGTYTQKVMRGKMYW